MSKSIKKDAPASANFVAVARPSLPTPAVPVPAEPIIVLGGDVNASNLSGNMTNANLPIGSCYIPTTTAPDYNPDWQRGLIGPNPGDNRTVPSTWPTQPGLYPVPGITGITYTLTSYWAVRRRTHINQNPREYYVVDPMKLADIPVTENILARCETENDARFLCDLLIKQDADTARWGIQRSPEESHSKYGLSFRKRSPEDLQRHGHEGIVALCKDESDASYVVDLLTRYTDSLQPARPEAKKVSAAQMVTYDYVQRITKDLAGRVLTVLDAAFVNEQQNKAVKSLTKREFRETLSKLWQYCYRDPDSDECVESDSSDDILD